MPRTTATAEHEHSPEHSADIQEAANAVDAKPKSEPKQRLSQETLDVILELRAQGMGVTTIARELENRNIKTATGKPAWHGPAIRGILVRSMTEEQWEASKDARKPTEKKAEPVDIKEALKEDVEAAKETKRREAEEVTQ
ncbi:MAG: recombinase family protein [Actinobacteria bacterium]|nr:recombinase family protein [Actinomycetota bacterium]